MTPCFFPDVIIFKPTLPGSRDHTSLALSDCDQPLTFVESIDRTFAFVPAMFVRFVLLFERPWTVRLLQVAIGHDSLVTTRVCACALRRT